MKTFKEICWENKIGLREFDIIRKKFIDFIEEKYHPDKSTIEISDLFDFFNITDEEIIKRYRK